MTPERDEHVARLHREAIIIDGHNDSLRASAVGDPRYNPLPDGPARPRRMWEQGASGHWDFPRALEAGQSGQITNILVPRPREGPFARTCLKSHHRALADLEHAPRLALLAKTTSDLERAHRDGVVGLVLAIEGAEALEGDLDMLHVYYRLGVRMLGLTWMYRNEVAEGNWEDTGAGLSGFGAEVVREMNELGIAVDVAHATEQTFWDTLEASTAPVVCSHGSCRSLVENFDDHAPSRYLSDDQMKALAGQGGVLGVFFSANRELAKPEADVSDLARFFAHAAEVMGPEHVALGSDFDGGFPPPGLEDVRGLPNLTSALIDLGFSDSELLGILGGNWLRVLRTVWDSP
ncbi:MAG: dipeptidase [Trueperaceae bacterium]